MNDEHQKPSGLDEKKKSALIHYVAILFIVAFIIVLISMLGTMRDSREDISALTQSSVSALQKAEQLQKSGEIRYPKRSDFTEEQVASIKAFLGPWPRALEKAGLKTKKADFEQ